MRWTQGSPEKLALDRHDAGTASRADYLLLALTEIDQAIECLPPHAGHPAQHPKVQLDPDHASCCAMRARAFLLLAGARARRCS